MANTYIMPVSMGACGCGGGGGYWCGGGCDGDSGCGCFFCDPGDCGPLPSPDNPWAFSPVAYAQTCHVARVARPRSRGRARP